MALLLVDLEIMFCSHPETFFRGKTFLEATLPQEQQKIFDTSLRHCNYDARLALLLALPNTSPSLAAVKVERH
ncbi:hypothetical protein HJFPF1_02649 [Paramyrothecium foliicola]|nr:hypothetical protein HJFPF1_02649 [Paramyrothecium foliicola]